MKIHYILTIAVLIFLFISNETLYAQKLPVEIFKFEGHALEDESVMSIYIDKNGFYWFGCYGQVLLGGTVSMEIHLQKIVFH